jgi:hypothetical protein
MSQTATSTVQAVANFDGTLEVFFTDAENVLYHQKQVKPGAGWTARTPLGTADNKALKIAVGENIDHRLEVFYIGTDNGLYHIWQVEGGGWSSQFYLGSDNDSGKEIAVGQNADQHLEVFYTGTNDRLYHTWQLRPGGGTGWSGEYNLGSSNDYGLKLAVGKNSDKLLEVFYVGTNSRIYHNWQVASGGWSGEFYLGTNYNAGKEIAVASNVNGNLEVFYVPGKKGRCRQGETGYKRNVAQITF